MNTKSQPQRSGKFKRFMSSTLAAFMALALCMPLNLSSAYATPTSAEKQAEADEVSAALAAAEKEMIQIGENYRLAVEAHDAAVAAMDEAQTRIDAAQAIIADTQQRLGYRANQMYRDGQLSFLDVIFGASSFEEFITRWNLLNMINQESAELIKNNKDARTEAQSAYDEFSAQEQVAAEREAEAEAIKARDEELIAEQQALLAGLEAEVAELVAAEQAARQAAEAEEAARQTPNPGDGGYIGEPIPGGGYADVVEAAYSRIGCPYVYGATGPNSFDCSGLTSWCYQWAGRGWIGRDTGAQYRNASAKWRYAQGGAQPGDVIYMPGHVGIYIGGGQYIHAPVPGEYVCVTSWNIENSTVLRF